MTSPGPRASQVAPEPRVWILAAGYIWRQPVQTEPCPAQGPLGRSPLSRQRRIVSVLQRGRFQSLLWPSGCRRNAGHGLQKSSRCPVSRGQPPAGGPPAGGPEKVTECLSAGVGTGTHTRPCSVPLTVRVGEHPGRNYPLHFTRTPATQRLPTSGSSARPHGPGGTRLFRCGCGLRRTISVLGFDTLPPPRPTMQGATLLPSLVLSSLWRPSSPQGSLDLQEEDDRVTAGHPGGL